MVNLNTVRIDFANAGAPVFNQATVGNIVSGAVTANYRPTDSAGTTAAQDFSTLLFNTIGSQPISGIVLNGQITDGPQLQSATGTASGLSVTYMFNPQPNGAGLTAPGHRLISSSSITLGWPPSGRAQPSPATT